MMSRRLVWLILALGGGPGFGQSLPRFDFVRGIDGWGAAHDVSRLAAGPEGMVIEIGGGDPYVHGPARDYPEGQPLWLTVRLLADQGGMAQVFWFTAAKGANEQNSVRFPVAGGEWVNVRVPVPALGPATRLRFDPPGVGGRCIVASLSFEARALLAEPAWPALREPTYAHTEAIESGPLRLVHDTERLGGYRLLVDGHLFAEGSSSPLIGYVREGELRWLQVAESASVAVRAESGALVVKAALSDPDGGEWEVVQRFAPAKVEGAIDVETRVIVSQDRSVAFLPMLTVLPGGGSFGETKDHALFAGLEYLENEPSSSEADIVGPGSKRQVPDNLRITFPLMAIQTGGRYVGLVWEKSASFSALFDSPDRVFGYGGHVMGVLFPGSNGVDRVEGSLLPHQGKLLAARVPLVLKATIIGGRGESVVPAVQKYMSLRGLPPVPSTGMNLQAYVKLAAGGWLDSKLREGDQYRHAYWPGVTSFAAGPAADAAVMEMWLAAQTDDAALASRLRAAAQAAAARVPAPGLNASAVSHVRYPVASLLLGHVAENADRALVRGRELVARFEPDGTVAYKAGETDYGRTHFARDANGLTAQVVSSLLEQATVCGDEELTSEGLRVLRALDKFANTAPRGAQTWEVPLHTPDVLAAAHLVRAYTIGYELTGDKHLLDMARYWAWTGVPFVYLVNPTEGQIGAYATTAVYGATNWTAPDWMGLPVQWCGLVYADALHRLVRHDPSGPWHRLADGITASGIQQSWPSTDRDLQGLLPDSFNLRAQTRNPVAINPGTVQANAMRLYDKVPLYDFHAFRGAGVLVHAPGGIGDPREQGGEVSFRVSPWIDQPYYILCVGFKSRPSVTVNGNEASLSPPNEYLESSGRLVLQLCGDATVRLTTR
jgi:hypothetical protein